MDPGDGKMDKRQMRKRAAAARAVQRLHEWVKSEEETVDSTSPRIVQKDGEIKTEHEHNGHEDNGHRQDGLEENAHEQHVHEQNVRAQLSLSDITRERTNLESHTALIIEKMHPLIHHLGTAQSHADAGSAPPNSAPPPPPPTTSGVRRGGPVTPLPHDHQPDPRPAQVVTRLSIDPAQLLEPSFQAHVSQGLYPQQTTGQAEGAITSRSQLHCSSASHHERGGLPSSSMPQVTRGMDAVVPRQSEPTSSPSPRVPPPTNHRSSRRDDLRVQTLRREANKARMAASFAARMAEAHRLLNPHINQPASSTAPACVTNRADIARNLAAWLKQPATEAEKVAARAADHDQAQPGARHKANQAADQNHAQPGVPHGAHAKPPPGPSCDLRLEGRHKAQSVARAAPPAVGYASDDRLATCQRELRACPLRAPPTYKRPSSVNSTFTPWFAQQPSRVPYRLYRRFPPRAATPCSSSGCSASDSNTLSSESSRGTPGAKGYTEMPKPVVEESPGDAQAAADAGELLWQDHLLNATLGEAGPWTTGEQEKLETILELIHDSNNNVKPQE